MARSELPASTAERVDWPSGSSVWELAATRSSILCVAIIEQLSLNPIPVLRLNRRRKWLTVLLRGRMSKKSADSQDDQYNAEPDAKSSRLTGEQEQRGNSAAEEERTDRHGPVPAIDSKAGSAYVKLAFLAWNPAGKHPQEPNNDSRRILKQLSRLGAAVVVAAIGAGCGGGGGGSGGSPAAQPTYSLNITQFGFDSTTVVAAQGQPNTSTKVSWGAARGGALSAYDIQAHLVPAGTPNAPRNDDNMFPYRNCGAGGTFGCDASGEDKCTCVASGLQATLRRIECATSLRKLNIAPGRYVGVARACYFDASLNEACSERSLAISLL